MSVNTFLDNLCAGSCVVLELGILQRSREVPSHNIQPLLSIGATWAAKEEGVVWGKHETHVSGEISLLQTILCYSHTTAVSDPSQFWILTLLLAFFSRWETEGQKTHGLLKQRGPSVPKQEMSWVSGAPAQGCHHRVVYFPRATMLLVK